MSNLRKSAKQNKQNADTERATKDIYFYYWELTLRVRNRKGSESGLSRPFSPFRHGRIWRNFFRGNGNVLRYSVFVDWNIAGKFSSNMTCWNRALLSFPQLCDEIELSNLRWLELAASPLCRCLLSWLELYSTPRFLTLLFLYLLCFFLYLDLLPLPDFLLYFFTNLRCLYFVFALFQFETCPTIRFLSFSVFRADENTYQGKRNKLALPKVQKDPHSWHQRNIW